MIKCEAVILSDEELAQVFEHLSQHELHDYGDSIELKKCQLFELSVSDAFSHLITSVTKQHGVTYFNALELTGAFGYATYPKEFLELLTNMAKQVNADEIRVMAFRNGAGKVLKDNGFTLKYAEYGINIK